MEENELFPERTNFQSLQESIHAVRTAIGSVIVGQVESVDLLLTAMLTGGHVLIEGVPGIAKTMTAKLLAKCLDIPFSRIQFTPDLMPSDVLGTSVFNPQSNNFEFRQGPIFSNIVLIDEINRAPAKTQAALFEVMEEKQVTMDGVQRKMDEPFMVLATQNPIEQEGTYRLPEAQLDRFLFKLVMHYPRQHEEVEILNRHHHAQSEDMIQNIRPVLSRQQIIHLKEKMREIRVEDALISYIAAIIMETRQNRDLFLGASPRASIALLNASKAMAAIKGRDFVTPEEILFLAPTILRHRLMLSPEKEMEGGTCDQVIQAILHKVEVPR